MVVADLVFVLVAEHVVVVIVVVSPMLRTPGFEPIDTIVRLAMKSGRRRFTKWNIHFSLD